jgi:hypothetical protein
MRGLVQLTTTIPLQRVPVQRTHVRVKESRVCVSVQLTTTNPTHARGRQGVSNARCPNLSQRRYNPDT